MNKVNAHTSIFKYILKVLCLFTNLEGRNFKMDSAKDDEKKDGDKQVEFVKLLKIIRYYLKSLKPQL
jgi:hypothetical protein